MEGYTKKITPKGYTRYYHQGKAIPKRDVPTRILKRLGGEPTKASKKKAQTPTENKIKYDEPEIIGTKNEDGILYSSPIYQGYEFTYDQYARRQFYHNGKKIKSRKVPAKVKKVLDDVDSELDFFHLIDQRTGARKKASLWLDIVEEDGEFSFYYIYRNWEIPGDRIPRRRLAKVRRIDSEDTEKYDQWVKEEKERKKEEIEEFRRQQYDKFNDILDERLNREREEKRRKMEEERARKEAEARERARQWEEQNAWENQRRQEEFRRAHEEWARQQREADATADEDDTVDEDEDTWDNNANPNSYQPPTAEQMNQYRQLLVEHGIYSKRDWYGWLRENHPDKNPDTPQELVGEINTAARHIIQGKI